MRDPTDPDDVVPDRWATRGVTDGAGVLAAIAADADQPIPPTRTVAARVRRATPALPGPDRPGCTCPAQHPGERGRGLGWKVDTRAHGGYIVAAGSITPIGAYRVIHDRDPVPLADWLTARLRPPALPPPPAGSIRTAAGRTSRYLAAAITAEQARVHNAPAGQRNQSLYLASIALGQLVAGGALAEHHARSALLDAAGRHLAIGAYSPHQAEQTITSGLRAGADRPRRIEETNMPPSPHPTTARPPRDRRSGPDQRP